jgi:hypothetical protein
MFRICGHFQQRGSGGIEQKGKQDLFVLPHQWDKQVRHAEDEMKNSSPAATPVGAWRAISRERWSGISDNSGRSCRRCRCDIRSGYRNRDGPPGQPCGNGRWPGAP